MYTLGEQIYYHIIQQAAKQAIDTSLLIKLEELKNNNNSDNNNSNNNNSNHTNNNSNHSNNLHRIYTHLLTQHSVHLLGRTINLSYIFTQTFQNKLKQDIDLVIKRYESHDIRGGVELTTLLSILQTAHGMFAQYLQLGKWLLLLLSSLLLLLLLFFTCVTVVVS